MSWLGGGEAGQVVVTQVSTVFTLCSLGGQPVLTQWSVWSGQALTLGWTSTLFEFLLTSQHTPGFSNTPRGP